MIRDARLAGLVASSPFDVPLPVVVGEVFELRIHGGPGYRVHYGREGDALVILLAGGDKGSQERDIERAEAYWRDYKDRDHGKS